MRRTALAVAFGLILGAVPVLAHHSISAEFDPSKEWSVTGVLSRIDWINPHTATWVDVKNAQSGEVEQWGCEGNPPATWHRAGLKKEDWKLGETVTLTCAAAKDGSRRANGRNLTFTNGKTLFLGSSGTGAPYELTPDHLNPEKGAAGQAGPGAKK